MSAASAVPVYIPRNEDMRTVAISRSCVGEDARTRTRQTDGYRLYGFIQRAVKRRMAGYQEADQDDIVGEIYCSAFARGYRYLCPSLFTRMLLGALEKLKLADGKALRPKKSKGRNEDDSGIILLSLDQQREDFGYEPPAPAEDYMEAREAARERIYEALETTPMWVRSQAAAVLKKDKNMGRRLTKYCALIRKKRQVGAKRHQDNDHSLIGAIY